MAELVAGFLGPAIQVVKWVAAPIILQFNYLCCFTSNINGLKDEAKKLDDEERELQGRVDRERDSLRVIVPKVDTWLTSANHIKDQSKTILDEVQNVESGCLKLKARFSLSKRAKKTTGRMKELRLQCKFDPISQEGPPTAREAVPLGKAYQFESRKQIEEDTMTALREGDVRMIGICGMGGLGKTTMAKTIMNRVLKECVFEEAVIAVVSQQVDKSKIQDEIAGSLGLKFEVETSQAAKVQKLHARLSGTKRILLVLDDVWQRLVLEDLGIPCDSTNCTILLTSRNSDTLLAMNVTKKLGMEVLSEEEAWFLFREGTGTCVDDTKLNSIAKQVTKECRGLPIALTTVGAALKDEKNPPIWEDALRQLRECAPDDIPEFIAEVYNPLKLSYDFLKSKQEKSLFLLCCLFPEDADIPLEYLTYFCMGLGIFGGIRNLEEGRNRMFALTKKLKNRSLLLDSDDENCVRMHDVVRDVCIFIAKQEEYIGGNACTWISSSQVPPRLGFPNLRLLFSDQSRFKFDSAFLEGIRDLHVLCIQINYSLTTLPHATPSLKNLNTLILDRCSELKTISFVGELVNLEILICRLCISIEELPPGIKGLNHLKLLDITGSGRLQRIGRGIISSLVGLEELKMRESFKKWEAENREERENAGLRELEALTNLTCLEIDIEDPILAAEIMHLSSKIQRFDIKFTKCGYDNHPGGFNKKLSLFLEEETCLGDWIEMQLLRDTECLSLFGNGANNVDLAKCQNIRWLELSRCETMKQLWNSSRKNYVPPFTNLSSIDIRGCPRLRNLGQLSIAGKDCLSQLEFLYIGNCKLMEQVFLWSEEDQSKNNSGSRNPHIKFPKLKNVALDSLPNLETFYQGIEGIEFPLLKKMTVKGCPKLKFITSIENPGCSSSSAQIDDDYAHLFCQLKQVSFSNLKELDSDWNMFCGHKIPSSLFYGLTKLTFSMLYGSISLFSSSIAGNLINLRVLNIMKCDEMLKVIEDKEEEEEEKMRNGGERALLLPKLDILGLEDLPKLVSFCQWKCDVELPLFREVVIIRCPDMEKFSLGFLAAPNLEAFTTDLKNKLDIGTNVPIGRLKELEIVENESPFYCHKIPLSLLNGLKELRVYKYRGSLSLFTSSIIMNLVSLEVLNIENCDEMVKVIENKEEEENEKVASGGERTLVFPKLQWLVLDKLPKLVSFCEWKCDVELPSLRGVLIHGCPDMKSFTMGSIAAAPNLETAQIEYEKIVGGPKDLNGILQQHYLARAKVKTGEEVEEKNNEIEEEQN